MTNDSRDYTRSDRRRFLARAGALGITTLAGCSIQTSFGNANNQQGGGSTPTQTEAKATAEETDSRSATTRPTHTVSPPTATTHSANGITVEVVPESQGSRSTGRKSLSETQTDRHDDMVCTTSRQETTVDGGGLLTGNLVLDHKLNEVWPGAIIPAESVAIGGFGPALAGNRLANRQSPEVRSPVTLALYIDPNRYESGEADVSKVIDPPTSNRVQQARVELLSQVQEGTSAARVRFNINQIHSQNHLNTHFGVDYNNLVLDIESDFDFSRSSTMNQLLVKFFQVYYLLGVTFPNPHGKFVTDWSVIRPNDLLVSDVAFGRLLLFSVESHHTVRDVSASVEAAFNWANDGSAELSTGNRWVFEETKLKGQAIGGGAGDALELISDYGDRGISTLQDYLQAGANYSSDNPGAPIGFTARYLTAQDRANTYLTTNYSARSCRPTRRRFRVSNVTLTVEKADADFADDTLEIFGDIYIWAEHPNQHMRKDRVWSIPEEESLAVSEGETKSLNVNTTIEFDIPDDQTWSEYMRQASIKVEADLEETDGGWTGNEWVDITMEGEWPVTSRLDQTPTLSIRDEVMLNFDVSPVSLQ